MTKKKKFKRVNITHMVNNNKKRLLIFYYKYLNLMIFISNILN